MPAPGDRFEWIDEPDGVWEVVRLNAGSMSVKKVTRERHVMVVSHKKVKKTVIRRGKRVHIEYKQELDEPKVVEVNSATKTLVISLNASVCWLRGENAAT